jgi:hypothetical protein
MKTNTKVRRFRLGSKRHIIVSIIQKYRGTFTFYGLVVNAFYHKPDLFSLPGYPHFPDSKGIANYLYGSNGLIALGLVIKVKSNVFKWAGKPIPLIDEIDPELYATMPEDDDED